MRAGRLRDTGRSFCCTRKYRKGRKRKKSERKSGNLLNTDLQNVSGLKFIDFGRYDYNTITVDDCIKDILRRTPVNDQYTYFGRFVRGQEFKVIVQSYPTGDYNSLILFGYASELTYYTKSPGGIAKHEIKCTSMFI